MRPLFKSSPLVKASSVSVSLSFAIALALSGCGGNSSTDDGQSPTEENNFNRIASFPVCSQIEAIVILTLKHQLKLLRLAAMA